MGSHKIDVFVLYAPAFSISCKYWPDDGKREWFTGCWWGNLRERGRWGDPDVDGRIILRCM
jgi:hypothetical protein